MKEPNKTVILTPTEEDPTAAERKRDHIQLAFRSQVNSGELDARFYYEPLFNAHPQAGSWPAFNFLGHTFRTPLWVSSMTGGTAMANTINHNLARACGEFGMGMGLGSCRQLLYSDDRLNDFAVKPLMKGQPLFANLGIAQLEQLITNNELYRINILLEKLAADGLIIHVNPLQEWLQPEGDRFSHPPLQTIETILEYLKAPIIVKEVGQGMGVESLKALLQLPLAAVDFAAAGGTNFAKLELLRDSEEKQLIYGQLANVGHNAVEMVGFVNQLIAELGDRVKCPAVIISGGIQNFLDGYYLINKVKMPAIYGQASGFLKYAQGEYATLHTYIAAQIEGLELARAFLKVR
ncbi:MAG: isopentenyl-diphosphate delta-isomerase [Haliscomenobacter sp.]|uniref:isopentenyl-diphosphate delta-isomerase n=1 Tax=Haliscomenobacter sp. TaxID=2717303 RepID=UPI0029B11B1F|nr:isopentenyl-diphosphate delta-isomerase [Haliscomenobacter sp.]MDX2072524.1 isopentenyl-diphosphate delta-isomerase [Haliscomenobacter sp.]